MNEIGGDYTLCIIHSSLCIFFRLLLFDLVGVKSTRFENESDGTQFNTRMKKPTSHFSRIEFSKRVECKLWRT